MPNFFKVFTLASVCLGIVGCTKPSVEGDVFVIKGDGSIAPSAGRTVFFLPYTSEKSFFHELVAQAKSFSVADSKSAILGNCAEALSLTQSLIQEYTNEISEIDSTSREPINDCDAIEKMVFELNDRVQVQNESYNKQQSEFEAQLLSAETSRSAAVQQKANTLRDQEFSKINIELVAQNGDEVQFKIINRSQKFCLDGSLDKEKNKRKGRLKIDFLAGQNVVSTQVLSFQPSESLDIDRIVTFSNQSDHVCDVMPGEAKTSIASIGIKDSRPPKISSLRFTNAGLHTVEGSILVPVDWLALSEATFDFSEYEHMVESARIALNESRSRQESDSLQMQLTSKERELNSCLSQLSSQPIKQRERLVRRAGLIAKLESLNQNLDDLGNCDSQSVSLEHVADAEKLLNEHFGGKFSIPDMEELFIQSFFMSLAGVLSSESVYRVETTIEGAYSIPEIAKGDYLVLGEYGDNFINGFWLFPVKVTEHQRADLNMNQFFGHPFLEYAKLQASQYCRSCSIEQTELMARSDADTYLTKQEGSHDVKKEFEKAVKELKDIMIKNRS